MVSRRNFLKLGSGLGLSGTLFASGAGLAATDKKAVDEFAFKAPENFCRGARIIPICAAKKKRQSRVPAGSVSHAVRLSVTPKGVD